MWIVVGVAAWLVVATLVGVLIGRMIRRRDDQVPEEIPVADLTGPLRHVDGAGRHRSRPRRR